MSERKFAWIVFENGTRVPLPVPPNPEAFGDNANARQYEAGFVGIYDESTSTGAMWSWSERMWRLVQPIGRSKFWEYCDEVAAVLELNAAIAAIAP